MSFLVEHVDKSFTDDFALAFRFCHAGQFAEELGRSVNTDYVQSKAFVVVKHILELVLAEHTVVNENTGKVLADGTVQKHCGNRRVDTTAQAEYHLVVAQLSLEFSNRRFDERSCAPILLGTTDTYYEVFEQFCAFH